VTVDRRHIALLVALGRRDRAAAVEFAKLLASDIDDIEDRLRSELARRGTDEKT
jgi:antitoxin (DNA-binding transcriptional repressor) of toxin-antitoxin stability system